jgi:adenylosuccinate lyase
MVVPERYGDLINPNVLAERYATPETLALWSRQNMVGLGRDFWLAVLREQRDQEPDPAKRSTMDIALRAYSDVRGQIDLDSITARELRLQHDQAAEIEEFNELAGFGMIHQKMTSRDRTDNIEQILILKTVQLFRDRGVAILRRLDERAREFAVLDMCGRSHFTPGTTTTLGKRFANIAQEFLLRFEHLEDFIHRFSYRGIKGPMGTQADQVINEYGLFLDVVGSRHSHRTLQAVGQVYPRSIDFETVALLVELAAPLANFAKMVRLMSGLDQMHEGFGENQVGSSAMPHKINARTCERIGGLLGVLKGHLAMVEHLLGDQWLEGDVSDSVVRRVVFPDALFALDGIYEATMTVLDQMQVFPKVIEAELHRYQPFMATTALLRAAIDKGMSRSSAHERIRRHAVRAVHEMRKGRSNQFVKMLADDKEFPFDVAEIQNIVNRIDHGQAEQQINAISSRIAQITSRYAKEANYVPRPIR